jgi:hypothetical protein
VYDGTKEHRRRELFNITFIDELETRSRITGTREPVNG